MRGWLQLNSNVGLMGALDVNIVRDSADWLLVVVGVLTAAGTVGAVVAALLGPGWRERAKRPDVRLVAHVGADKNEQGWQKDIDISRDAFPYRGLPPGQAGQRTVRSGRSALQRAGLAVRVVSGEAVDQVG